MKTWKKLLAALLTVAMICVLAACVNPETPAGNTATVTFMNGSEVYETVTFEYGSKITLPKAPRGEKGKGLVGWTTIDGDVEEVIAPETFVVEADITLYALWADVYTVVINADNGTAFDVKEVFAGDIVPQPDDPVKEGYKFVEWRDALAETTFDWTQPIYADVTIKAMYGDGSPNRVSDTKWDFTLGHGAWVGSQGGWNYNDPKTGLPVKDMVYTTTEDGYAAWGFTKTDSLDNVPVVNGENGEGYGMKYIYNEGISVAASKAKLVVMYMKPKHYPIDMSTSPNDQFRISVLTSNGGMIYGYGTGSEAWSLRTDAGSKNLIQVDQMEDGWIRVQFKIHELDVWSEDAIIKGMAISIVQRKATPVMDILSFKSIELLDQEEFIDPHKVDYVTNNQWDMTKEEESKNWFGVMQTGSNTTSVKTTIDANGTQYVYGHTNAWRGMTLNLSKIDISKCSGFFSATMDISGMNITQYRIYIVTDKGGDLYKNSGRDDVSCYYAATSPTDLADGWTVTPNADGTVTVSYDLTKLEYWKTGTELQGMSFVTVDATTNGTVVYKSVSLVDTVKTHNCETDGHVWKDATCTEPKTCAVCGTTDGEPAGHNMVDNVCSVCGFDANPAFTGNRWDMTNSADSKYWASAQDVKLGDVSSTTVTEAGTVADYTNENGWKGLYLQNAKIAISKLSGKLTFTYSTDLNVTAYRIHIMTDKGGALLSDAAKDANYYATIKIADITADNVAWSHTVNGDGTVTVTFDLSTLPYFAEGTELNGLTIVTVTDKVSGTVTYKSIELEAGPIAWDMNNAEDAAQWAGYHAKKKNEALTTTVTEAGLAVAYGGTGNGWKGIVLEDAAIDISKLTGKLTFTYSCSDMKITNYRIHILTDLGGNLTANGTVDCYVAVSLSDIEAGNLAAWTKTVNEDGSITVTFDLATLKYFADGTEMKGLTIVTQTANSTTGTVTYKSIEIR